MKEGGGSEPERDALGDPVALLALDLVNAFDDDREHFWIVLLNTLNRYLMHVHVSTGTLSASLVHPREVFGPALRVGAASLILVHNHPSGDPTPSREDLRLTRSSPTPPVCWIFNSMTI